MAEVMQQTLQMFVGFGEIVKAVHRAMGYRPYAELGLGVPGPVC